MNIAQLATFVMVVEHGSFSEAARAMDISQPAVTMQMQALESELGATLLDRRYRRVTVTEAGEIMLPYARSILDAVDRARLEIERLSGDVRGPLHIAASTTPGTYVIPQVLGGFLAANPEVRASVSVLDSAEVVEAVASGRADIGVSGARVKEPRVEFEHCGIDELIVIAPPGHMRASVSAIEAHTLAEERWVMREKGSGTRQVAKALLGPRGLDIDELFVALELGTGEAVLSAVEGGLGIAVISRHVAARALEIGSVIELDVEGLPATRPFFVVTPKGSTKRTAQAFRDSITRANGS